MRWQAALGLFCFAVSGCGSLWRPFLEGNAPGNENPQCQGSYCDFTADLAYTPLSDMSGMNVSPDWEVIDFGKTFRYNAVWGKPDEKRVYFGSSTGLLLEWNSNNQITPIDLPKTSQGGITALSGWTNGEVLVAGDSNLLVYYDGQVGSIWEDIFPTTGASSLKLSGALLTGPRSLWTVGVGPVNRYGTARITLSTFPMSQPVAPEFLAVWPAVSNSVWIAGSNGTIYLADTATGIPKPYVVSAGNPLRALWATAYKPVDFGAPRTEPYVVGDGSLLFRYQSVSDRFLPVPTMPTGKQTNYLAIWGTTRGDLFIGGSGGVVWLVRNSIWTRIDPGPDLDIRGIWCQDNSTQPWIVGDNGMVLHRKTPL